MRCGWSIRSAADRLPTSMAMRQLPAAWDEASEAKRRWFDNRSARLVGATAAGVEALLDERQNGHEPHALASQELVDQIRRELAQVSRVILG